MNDSLVTIPQPTSTGNFAQQAYARFRPVLDADDVSYIINTLGEAQVRRELSNWNVTRAELWGDTPEMSDPRYMDADDFFWWDHMKALKLALLLIRQAKMDQRKASHIPVGQHHIDADELKSQTDIVAVIGRYLELKRRGGHWWGCCPFHSEKSPSFMVYENSQHYHCFGCQAHGDVIAFIMRIEHTDFRGALAILERI